jgi:hypothetical protein
MTAALPCLNVNRPPLVSGFVLDPPEKLHCSREIQYGATVHSRKVVQESGRLRREEGWQDKAGFPAAGTSFLSFCLHIVFGRSPTFRRNLSSFRLCACLCNPLHGANTPGRDRATRRIGEAKDASEAAQVQASGPSDMCRRLRLPVHINGENSWELCSEFRELDPSDPGRRYRWASQGGGWGREGDVYHHPVVAMEPDRQHPLKLAVSCWFRQ